mgnify:CR=1 FL=1
MTERGTIAITGAGGQLGRALVGMLGRRALPLPRAALDVTDQAAVRRLIAEAAPAVVINCAAWTNVDKAESEPGACRAANEAAVAALAAACADVDALLVQVSTDYVFGRDVGRREPWREEDPTCPAGTYAATKLAGEAAARGWRRHQIVRTCGLYSVGPEGPVRGRNFADTMLVLARDRPELRVVADQHCTPSYVPHVAAAILALAEEGTPGTYHATNAGATTWHGFATELFRQAGLATTVTAIASADWPSPVARPPYSVLDCSRLAALGIVLPDWREGIAAYLAAGTG